MRFSVDENRASFIERFLAFHPGDSQEICFYAVSIDRGVHVDTRPVEAMSTYMHSSDQRSQQYAPPVA